MAMSGGAVGLAFGARAVQLIRSCASNPLCLNRLGIAVGEAAAGDALGGATLSITVAAGSGRLVLQKGDEIVGLIDDALGRLVRVGDTVGDSAPLFRAADGVLYRLDSAQGLSQTATNRTVNELLEDASGRLNTLVA